MSTRAVFRDALRRDGMIVAPGVYDSITARLVESAGFLAVYMTGAGVSASLGFPDYGLLTMSEMVERAGVIIRTVHIPLISEREHRIRQRAQCDANRARVRGTGNCRHPYRGPSLAQAMRPSRWERDRIAGGFLSKIRAAVAARRDPLLVIIARTDARAVVSFEEAIDRANAAIEAGADMAFVEAPQTMEELSAVPRLVKGPCLLNVVPGGKTPAISMTEAQDMGFKLAIFPGLLLGAAVIGGDRALQILKGTDSPPNLGSATIKDAFLRFGATEWDRFLLHQS